MFETRKISFLFVTERMIQRSCFFVHFEKDNAECVGELKGTARMISPTKAYYKAVGNPCTIEFTFNGPAVVMKEIEGCGSYRDIKCFFEGTYPRKKEKPSKKST